MVQAVGEAIEVREELRTADDPVLADEQSGLLPVNGRALYMEPIGMTNLAPHSETYES